MGKLWDLQHLLWYNAIERDTWASDFSDLVCALACTPVIGVCIVVHLENGAHSKSLAFAGVFMQNQ